MFFTSRNNRVIERNGVWYVETWTGYEGPFDSQFEAQQYLSLKKRADMARVEFAGLEDRLRT